MLPLVLALLAPLAGKGADAGRASAVAASYVWEVVSECPTGAVVMRSPLYPGRLGVFRDWGCAIDYLDVDGRRVPFSDATAVFPVPLEWLPTPEVIGHAKGQPQFAPAPDPEPRMLGACSGDDCAPIVATIARADYPQSIIAVDSKFVAPSDAEKKRIERDHAHIATAFQLGELGAFAPLWTGPFMLPRPPVFTSMFGAERVISDKKNPKAEPKRTRHLGLDFDGQIGEPIVAVQAGVITLAEPLFYSGGTIFIAHGDGLVTMYFHMSKIIAHQGDHVSKGTLIGLVGKEGRVTGPHLHLSAKWHGTYFDPDELFESFDQGGPTE